MSDADNGDEIRDLSNNDIETLWQVIQRVHASPGSPFGPGLFASYNSYVEDNDVSEGESQKYFRFLVRLVAGRTAADSLAGRFKRLLAEHGIEVNFDSDILSPEERTREAEEEEAHYSRDFQIGDKEDRFTDEERSEATSADSQHEAESWRTGEQLDGASEYSRHPKHTRSSSRASDPTGVRKRSTSHHRRLLEQLPLRGRVNNRSVSDNVHTRRQIRAASISSQGSLRIFRKAGSVPIPNSRRASQSSVDRDAAVRKFLEEYEYVPSDTQLLADADTFEYHGKVRLTRQIFQYWLERTRDVTRQRDKQLQKARSIVERGMKKECFKLWNDSYRERRLEHDVNHFWAAQEVQAQTKWNIHLMEKAFIHWATTAQEHVQRTAVARRHILRNKYFNAWKDVTAVNALKVQRFRLRKFFNQWRGRLDRFLDHDDTAVAVYEQSLAHRVFMKWLWCYRDNVAGYWAEDKIRRRFFNRWRNIVRQIRQRESLMTEIHQHDEQRRLLQMWKMKVDAARQDEAKAEDFRRRKLKSHALQAYHTQAKLFPFFRQVADRVDTRIARSALQAWHLRAQQSTQAARIDRMRLMRNALTSWDDQLRCSWLQHRIDDRILVEALYKLSIASKASMHARLRDYKLLSNCLQNWSVAAQQRANVLQQALLQSEQSRRQIKLRYAWNRLRSRYHFYNEDEQVANSHLSAQKLPSVFQSWRIKAQAVQQMNSESDAARYYFVMTNAIKLWRNATHESQRVRRREAYSTVRRLCKTNMARAVMSAWQSKLATVQEMEQVATERGEDRVLSNLTSTFRTWRDRSALVSKCSQQALDFRRRHLTTGPLLQMQASVRAVAQLNAQVQPFKTELAAVHAQKAFAKLGWRVFELQRLNENAFALRDKHWQSHVRSMLRYWAERASLERLQRGETASDIHDNAMDEDDNDGGDTGTPEAQRALVDATHIPADTPLARAHQSFTLDDSALDFSRFKLDLDLLPSTSTAALEGIAASTPALPGYLLRTPSKRNTARSRARERLLALTAGRQGAVLATPGAGYADAPGRAATAPPGAAGRVRLGDGSVQAITPFEQRLRAKGYSASGSARGGIVTPGSGRRDARFGSGTQGGGVGFVTGFEDIAEHDLVRMQEEE